MSPSQRGKAKKRARIAPVEEKCDNCGQRHVILIPADATCARQALPDRETLIGLAIVAADKAEAKMRAIDYRLLGSPAARTYREHAAVDAVLAALRERGMG